LIFLAAYALVLSGFVLMPQLGTQLRSRVRVMLDGTIGALSVVTILWVFYYDTLAALLASATFWERFAGLAYPVADSLLVVAALIVTIRRSIWRFDLRVVFFGIGMVVQAIADLTLLSTGVGQTFEEAKPNFFLFLVAVMFYLSTAAVIRKSPRVYEFADRGQPLWSLLAPYAPSLIVVAIIVVRLPLSQLDGELQLLLLGGLLLGALVVTRQAVALREYRSAVDQQRSALVASVSHELRTPLTAMVGFLNVMNTQPEDLDEAEKAELTDVVYQQALYMSRIVADLLLLARDSSALQLKEADVSVNDLILDRIRTLTNPDATIETEIEPNLVAHVDSDRLRQVLANLLVNGRRYGRGKVLLRAVSVDHDLMIEVHDNGNGVPRKYELAIWNQFERGAHRLNSAVPGSGIGLAVVNRIVRRHGGTASYERSKRLGGSCFRIVLPGRMRRPATSEEYVVAGQVAAT
jgi:signal transduction histidine kinase